MKRGLLALSLLLLCGAAFAAESDPGAQNQILSKVGFDQNLNAQIPLDAAFTDSTGRKVTLGRYFGDKPVILSLVYYHCPMLCSEALDGLLRGLRSLSFDVGKEFNVVIISFDPNDTPADAAAKKKIYIERYNRPGAADHWAFLTGDAASIAKVTRAAGFRYVYDPALKQYAHATGLMVATPQGKISRYLYGVEYPGRELRLALVDSSAGKIGSPVDLLLLCCYRYDPVTGRYGLLIMRVLRLAGVVTVLALGLGIWLMSRVTRRAPRKEREPEKVPETV